MLAHSLADIALIPADFRAYLVRCSNRLQAASRARALAMLRNFFRFLGAYLGGHTRQPFRVGQCRKRGIAGRIGFSRGHGNSGHTAA